MDVPGSLGPSQRQADIERLRAEHLDVLVIGGGVTGVGCALDAASRGLKVGLVEQRDLASGTSSRSSKLIHGGLRYLEQRDFGLVREALRERGLLMGLLCPHLVRPVSFVLPVPGRIWSRLYYGAGVLLYDLLAAVGRTNTLPRHRHLSKRAALALVPGLDPDALAGAIVYSDAQLDDARHTLAVARTASQHGAAIAPSVEVTGLIIEDEMVVGAHLLDVESGAEFDTRATRVVNATGVWSDDIQDMAEASGATIRAAKGVHIVVGRDRIEGDAALILRTPTSVLLVIPWGAYWLIGTTDTEWAGGLAHPAASKTDIDYILTHANRALRQQLTTDDIVGLYVGLRPLVDTKAAASAKLTREHVVVEPRAGLVTIAGGKYTTYRVMASDTIDVAAKGFGRAVPKSSTDGITLIGSEDWSEWSTRSAELAREYSLPEPVIERLLWRHGSRISDVLDIMSEDGQLSEVLPGGGYLAAEVVHAARHEGALHLDDVLARRTRIYIETPDRGVDAAPLVARLLGRELGWDDARTEMEISAWKQRVAAERAANQSLGDDEADHARRNAIDGRDLLRR